MMALLRRSEFCLLVLILCFPLTWVCRPLLAVQPEWEAVARKALQQGQLEVARRAAENALHSPATAVAAHGLLGEIAFLEKRDEDAVRHFEAAGSQRRLTPEVERSWSGALLNLRRYAEAGKLLTAALSRDPSQTGLRYRLAGAYSDQGKWKEAWPHLEQVYREGWTHAGVMMQLARARFSVGEDFEAVELLKTTAATSASSDLLLESGKLLFEKTLYRQAKLPLEKIWSQKPGAYETGMYLALCDYLMEQYAESESVLLKIQTGPAMPLDYQILLGSVQARLGRWDAARQELEKAIQHSPQRADGYLNLGFFYLETGNAPHARELLEKASRLMARGTKLLYTIRSRKNCDGLKPPESAESRDIQRGAFYSQLAEQLHSMKQRGAALEVFRLALEADPESASAHAGAGRVCWEMDSLPESRSLLERGLRLHPEFSQLHFVNGLVQQSLGASEEAIASYRKAIQLQGPNASALSWIQLGTAQAAGGKIAEAESSIRQGLSLDPGLAQGHYELGKVCFQQGRFECAEQSLEEAIQLDPRQVGAYYQLGLTCLRTGKREKGKRLLETFHRKKELYASDVAPMEPLASPSP